MSTSSMESAGFAPTSGTSSVAPRNIREAMTPAPHTIHPDTPIPAALQRMREHGVRHLPVLEDGALLGMISERDIYLMRTRDGHETTVREAMTYHALTVSPDTAIADAAVAMWQQRCGSVAVVEDGTLVGIFTTTDALRVLATMAL